MRKLDGKIKNKNQSMSDIVIISKISIQIISLTLQKIPHDEKNVASFLKNSKNGILGWGVEKRVGIAYPVN